MKTLMEKAKDLLEQWTPEFGEEAATVMAQDWYFERLDSLPDLHCAMPFRGSLDPEIYVRIAAMTTETDLSNRSYG